MEKKIIKKEEEGFALLFSVLVSSLLLTTGLSIFSIALKELMISTATRQSIHAFYAADGGLEYVKYKDLKIEDSYPYIEDEIKEYPTSLTFIDGSEGPNYNVIVIKEKNTGQCGDLSTGKAICTTITSRGYDSDSGDKVERAIEQIY